MLDNILQFFKDLWNIFTNFDKMVKFSNTSLWLIIAPYLVKILPFPFLYIMSKMKERKMAKKMANFDKQVNNKIDMGEKFDLTQEQIGYLSQSTKERLMGMQQGGAGVLSVFLSSPGFIEYISTILLIVFVYYWESSEKCGSEADKKRKEYEKITKDLKNGKGKRDEAQAKLNNLGLGYSFTQLFWDGLYVSIVPMIFYFGYYTFLMFVPLIGIALKIIQMIPIINKLFGGVLIYFFYNIARNFRDVTKRSKCQ